MKAFSHICTRICYKMRKHTFTPHLLRDILPHIPENVPVTVFFYPSHLVGVIKRSVSKSNILVFLAPLLGLTGKEWRKRRHTPDKARQDLSCLPVTYAIGSPTFKSVIRVPNSQTGLVGSVLVWLHPKASFLYPLLTIPLFRLSSSALYSLSPPPLKRLLVLCLLFHPRCRWNRL
jgi:hypothetical protein